MHNIFLAPLFLHHWCGEGGVSDIVKAHGETFWKRRVHVDNIWASAWSSIHHVQPRGLQTSMHIMFCVCALIFTVSVQKATHLNHWNVIMLNLSQDTGSTGYLTIQTRSSSSRDSSITSIVLECLLLITLNSLLPGACSIATHGLPTSMYWRNTDEKALPLYCISTSVRK